MIRWISLLLAALFAVPAIAKDFNFGGRRTSCADAAEFRDRQLFDDFVSAVSNFDETREQRINAAILGFKDDVAKASAAIDKADAAKRRRIYIAVAGTVLGTIASKTATVGIKQPLSKAEESALKAVAERGADWYTTFVKYADSGSIDATGIAVMPFSLLMALTPFATAEAAWVLGNTGIDIATAVAEAEIIRGEAKVDAATTRARADALARKLQKPAIQQIKRLKEAIDSQCG